MSDTYDKETHEPTDDQPTLFEGLAADTVHDSVAFDKTPMSQPHEDGILKGDDLVDPATLPENMPPTEITILPPPEHQFRGLSTEKTPVKANRLWPKRLGYVAGGLALAGAAFMGTRSGDPDDSPRNESRSLEGSGAPAAESPAIDTLQPTNTTLGESTNAEEVPESKTPEALIPASDDPQELLDILLFNSDCFRNTGVQECLKNYSANPTNAAPDSIALGMQQARQEILDHRQYMPEYTLQTHGTVTDYDFSRPDIRTLEFSAVQSSDDGVIQEEYQYDGVLEIRAVSSLDIDGNDVVVWLVTSQETNNGRIISSK